MGAGVGDCGDTSMKALILAAGYGTRLKEIAKDTPKPLLPVTGRPLVDYIVDRVKDLPGLTDIIVVTNDKFCGQFESWARTHKDVPGDIVVVNDGTRTPEERLGSIGDIHFVLESGIVDEDLLILGGDNLFDYSLNEYVAFARKQDPAVTIGLYDIGDISQASKFGVVSIGGNRKIISFEEKPAKPRSSLIAMCVYHLPEQSLGLINEYLKDVGKSDTAGDYIRWLREKKEVFGFTFTGTWYDIGSIEAYHEAQNHFSNIKRKDGR